MQKQNSSIKGELIYKRKSSTHKIGTPPPVTAPIGGLSQEEVDIAFNLLSADKKTVTHNDVKNFIHEYFDWMPEEALSTLNLWKEEVGKEQFISILVDKVLLSSPHQTAFQWFKPDIFTQTIGRNQLRKIAKCCLSDTTPNKDDVHNLLNEFDLDRDKAIGFKDWLAIGAKSRPASESFALKSAMQ